MALKKKNPENKIPMVTINQAEIDEHDKQVFVEIVKRHLSPISEGIGMVYASEAMPNPLSGDSVE